MLGYPYGCETQFLYCKSENNPTRTTDNNYIFTINTKLFYIKAKERFIHVLHIVVSIYTY